MKKDKKDKSPNKEGYFGTELAELLTKEGSPIPLLVYQSIKWLKSHKGEEEEGIFRISATAEALQEQKKMYETYFKERKFLDFAEACKETHVVSGLLKSFFRELPNPLIPYEFYSGLIDLTKVSDRTNRINSMREILSKLPQPNRETFLYIMKFLNSISKLSDINKMTASNLATVWGPNVLYPPAGTVDLMNSISESNLANLVIEDVIENYDKFSLLCNLIDIDRKCAAAIAKIKPSPNLAAPPQFSPPHSPNTPRLKFPPGAPPIANTVAAMAVEGRNHLRKVTPSNSPPPKETANPIEQIAKPLRRASMAAPAKPSSDSQPVNFRSLLKSNSYDRKEGVFSSAPNIKIETPTERGSRVSFIEVGPDDLPPPLSKMEKKRAQSVGTFDNDERKQAVESVTREEALLKEEEELRREEEEIKRAEEELVLKQMQDQVEEAPPSYEELYSNHQVDPIEKDNLNSN
jgi:hypothetical protein